MCGIFGVVHFDEKPVDKEKVIRARDRLTHRGPDDKGIFISKTTNAVFGHRRLSIIDLSPLGHQPMTTEDGRYTILHNGEIYNYKELANELKSRGQNLISNSDTEVLLKLFVLDGKQMLQKLRGMFAFVIWDDKEKKLFAARDRFGIKPFYYLHNNNEFIFSSELKAIKFYTNNLTISEQGIDAFLKTGSVPAPLTIYKETNALLPGHHIELEFDGKIKTERWWHFLDLFESTKQLKQIDNDAVRIALLDSIESHCVSDVEVGAFLSGGIDSSAIVSLMRQIGKEKIKTISITFPGNKLDESKYAKIVAEKFGTDHYEYELTEDELIEDFDKIMDAMDQPTIDGVNSYFVSKAAHNFGLKVVMSGLGGDELFGGYSSFNDIPRYNRIKNIPFAKSLMKISAPIAKSTLPAKAYEFMKNPEAQNSEYKLIRGLFTDFELRQLGWKYDFPHPFNNTSEANNRTSNFELNNYQKVSELETIFYMRNQLLRDSDVFSMAHSLELRVPFVDHILYSSVMPSLQINNRSKTQKKLLVEGVGNLPDEIVNRPKMGFTFPFGDWMKNGKMNELITESLNSKFFDHSAIQSYIHSFQSGKVHWSRVWAISVLNKYGVN
ncbi:MAG: asparagine synthase (glutamine-hydrolyzing) [Bacteroidetes bacterium]|nr:asparagine synthase (glutamine-hydrolyzing) [Bacteroidota bacterium]